MLTKFRKKRTSGRVLVFPLAVWDCDCFCGCKCRPREPAGIKLKQRVEQLLVSSLQVATNSAISIKQNIIANIRNTNIFTANIESSVQINEDLNSSVPQETICEQVIDTQNLENKSVKGSFLGFVFSVVVGFIASGLTFLSSLIKQLHWNDNSNCTFTQAAIELPENATKTDDIFFGYINSSKDSVFNHLPSEESISSVYYFTGATHDQEKF